MASIALEMSTWFTKIWYVPVISAAVISSTCAACQETATSGKGPHESVKVRERERKR
jgi:hypothetical protein